MEPNCCTDKDVCKPGTLSAPSACFDDCRLSLTKDDFQKIDTNNSGNLTAMELTNAVESGGFSGSKLNMVQCIRDHVNNTKQNINIGGDTVSAGVTLPSWFDTKFATSQISRDDFKLIDTNGNNLLESNELRLAGSTGLSKMSKHAASILSNTLDATLNDPLLSVQGGIRNWHGDNVAQPRPDVAAGAGAPGVPGLSMKFAQGDVSVSNLDERGNPTRLEVGNSVIELKHDAMNRVTEIRESYPEGIAPTVTTVEYDAEKRTQTLKQNDYDGQPTTTTLHLDDKGRVVKEEFQNQWENTTTDFDENGRIARQVRSHPQGLRTQSSLQYDDKGQRTATRSTTFGADGLKDHETEIDHTTNTGREKFYNEEGRPTRVVETLNMNTRKPTIRETTLGADGNPTGSTEMTFGDKLYLIGEMTQKDGQGNVIGTSKPEWQTRGGMGIVKSIQYTDASGTRTLNDKSTGEDRKLYNDLRTRLYRNSHYPVQHGRVDEESPGWFRRSFGSSPA